MREITGADFTAKDFRTWAGTVLAAMALREIEKSDTKAQQKKNITKAIETVAAKLGTTRSAFARQALRDALMRRRELAKEKRHREGYRRKPARSKEFSVWHSQQVWPDE